MWLVGMMGAGKTSVGRLVAERLGVPFYDTDDAVVATAGRTIVDIWSEEGEDGFREMERDAIAKAPPGAVAAAGGGAVLDAENREVMRSRPPVIWLRARPETLSRRVGAAHDRPLLDTVSSRVQGLQRILETREAAYQAAATHVIDTDGRDIEDVAREVTGLWDG